MCQMCEDNRNRPRTCTTCKRDVCYEKGEVGAKKLRYPYMQKNGILLCQTCYHRQVNDGLQAIIDLSVPPAPPAPPEPVTLTKETIQEIAKAVRKEMKNDVR